MASQLRGSGLAKDLLDLLIKKAKEKAFDTLVLDTGKGNVSANKFYSKHGFELFTPSDAMMREWKEAGESEKFNYYLMKLS